MEEILKKIREERARQDAKWGGPEHDDTHDAPDWIEFIEERTDAMMAGFKGENSGFLEIAALAVAALESIERKKNL